MADPYEKEMRQAKRKEEKAREAGQKSGNWDGYHQASQYRDGLQRDQWSAIQARENLKRGA